MRLSGVLDGGGDDDDVFAGSAAAAFTHTLSLSNTAATCEENEEA